MGGSVYRCDVCRETTARCEPCRARRAKANAERRDAYRDAGKCVMCGKRVKKGFTRCGHHMALNAQHSAASHAKATAEAREAEEM